MTRRVHRGRCRRGFVPGFSLLGPNRRSRRREETAGRNGPRRTRRCLTSNESRNGILNVLADSLHSRLIPRGRIRLRPKAGDRASSRSRIEGEISPITVEIVGDAIAQAHSENAALLLIRLNTPGGLLDATREIIRKADASRVPVVTYVEPSGARAASAGFFILEAGDIAAMAPGTNTGASSPVLLVGQMDKVMRDKVENDAAALLRSMMTRRGRNAEVGEQTVRQGQSVHRKRSAG